MKRFFCYSLSVLFALGVLFPVKSTGEGKSPFIQEIKKVFHKSPDKIAVDDREYNPIKGEKASHIYEDLRGIFHYESGKVPVKSKNYPKKFDKKIKEELRYPTK